VDGDEVVALLFVVDNRFALKDHWRVLKRVMVTPRGQGAGSGAALMREAEALGRQSGLAALQVTVRRRDGHRELLRQARLSRGGPATGGLRVGPATTRRDENTCGSNLSA
jgi:GNAT superfamily N-acetyltransferase